MKRTTRYTLIVLGLSVVLLGAFTEVLGNSFLLLTDGGRGGYFIPAESSIFTFRQTEANDGSGGWWIRGEDGDNFFALDPAAAGYVVYPKPKAAGCPGFDATQLSSWCPANVRRVRRP